MEQLPEYKFRFDRSNIGFEIQKISYLFDKHRALERLRPHRLKFYAIIIPTVGEGIHEINFKNYQFQKQDLIFISKDDIHAWKKWKDSDGYIILFTQEFLNQNQTSFNDLSYSFPFNPILYNPLIQLKGEQFFSSISSLINLIYHEFNEAHHKETKEILQCLLRTIFLKIRSQSDSKELDTNKKSTALFIRLQQELNGNLSISRNANDYCEKLNASYKELNEVCKTFTNKTVKAFIDETTIFKAKKYLIEPDKNISTTAYMLGFDETTNFTKFFKKHTNQTPKQFISKVSK